MRSGGARLLSCSEAGRSAGLHVRVSPEVRDDPGPAAGPPTVHPSPSVRPADISASDRRWCVRPPSVHLRAVPKEGLPPQDMYKLYVMYMMYQWFLETYRQPMTTARLHREPRPSGRRPWISDLRPQTSDLDGDLRPRASGLG